MLLSLHVIVMRDYKKKMFYLSLAVGNEKWLLRAAKTRVVHISFTFPFSQVEQLNCGNKRETLTAGVPYSYM